MTKQTATMVVKSFWVLCLVALALLFCGCRTKPAKSFYVPPSSVVEVTDPAPAIKSVDRAVTRVEAKMEAATARVESVEAKVDKVLEDAIRRQDTLVEAAMRPLRDEIRTLRIESDRAREQSAALRDDVLALNEAANRAAAERAEAVASREQLRLKAEADARAWTESLARVEGERARVEKTLAWWRAKALWTWSILGALCAAAVAWKVWKPL